MANSPRKTIIVICYLHLVHIAYSGGDQEDDCIEQKCGSREPHVRFPFWLEGRHPEHCGHAGFKLSCGEYKRTMLELPKSVQVSVHDIDYVAQRIEVYVNDCVFKLLIYSNQYLSSTPFHLDKFGDDCNTTLLNCSKKPNDEEDYCSDFPTSKYRYKVYCSGDRLENYNLESCRKVDGIYNITSSTTSLSTSSTTSMRDSSALLSLKWFEPNCTECEVKGEQCRSSSNDTDRQFECYVPTHNKRPKKPSIIAGVILGGTFVLALVIMGFYRICSSFKVDKISQAKIRLFLKNYKALKPTRYSYVDIKRITNQFSEELGQGAYGTVFKGKLSYDIMVAVKVLDNSAGNGEQFINEVGSMASIHHFNVARLLGFCADGYRRALVYEFFPNKSLDKFIISDNGGIPTLGWEKTLDIALGIAKGIEYLHQGCEQRILHFDIKPHNILLDDNFNPKISDFGLSKLCSKEKSAVSMTGARGTFGYTAPEMLSRNFGHVSHKSDVYSFGMLLVEMVGGKRNRDVDQANKCQVYIPDWIYNHLYQGMELKGEVNSDEHDQIAKKLTIVGLRCIQWYPADRPSMSDVVQLLKDQVQNLTVPPDPFTAMMPSNPFDTGMSSIAEAE